MHKSALHQLLVLCSVSWFETLESREQAPRLLCVEFAQLELTRDLRRKTWLLVYVSQGVGILCAGFD